MEHTILKISNRDVMKVGSDHEFMIECFGQIYRGIKSNLINNNKKTLEVLATKIFYPTRETPKTFREKKGDLVDMITPYIQVDKTPYTGEWEKVETDIKKFTLPAGKYYIGDLCYALKKNIYDHVWGTQFGYMDGIYKRKSDNSVFAMKGTGGDGEFRSTDNDRTFEVDAGIIGIASEKICDDLYDGYDFYTFPSEVTCEFTTKELRFSSETKSFTIYLTEDD